MDGLHEFLEDLKQRGRVEGHLVGLFHVLIGRRVEKADGHLVSNGVTWRELAEALKRVRWNKESVRELGIEPDQLPPRDRLRFWFQAIGLAQVDTPEASEAADRFIPILLKLGYTVTSVPTCPTSA